MLDFDKALLLSPIEWSLVPGLGHDSVTVVNGVSVRSRHGSRTAVVPVAPVHAVAAPVHPVHTPAVVAPVAPAIAPVAPQPAPSKCFAKDF